MDWKPVDRHHFRAEFEDEMWHLVATPGKRKPWLLYCGEADRKTGKHPREQEIGAPQTDKAKDMATLWLRLQLSTTPR